MRWTCKIVSPSGDYQWYQPRRDTKRWMTTYNLDVAPPGVCQLSMLTAHTGFRRESDSRNEVIQCKFDKTGTSSSCIVCIAKW